MPTSVVLEHLCAIAPPQGRDDACADEFRIITFIFLIIRPLALLPLGIGPPKAPAVDAH
ncbi:MAG: hypothetical protein ACJ8AI_12465 [Rhodopila sp.]